MQGTWKTTGGGGGGTGAAVLVVLAAAVIVNAAGPVVHAAGELVRLVLIAGGAVASLGLASGAALVVYRWRHRQAIMPLRVHRAARVTWQTAQAVQEPQRPAIEAPRQVHLHFHGVTADEVAAIIARQSEERG